MNDKKDRIRWNRGQALVWLMSALPMVLAAVVYQKLPKQIPTNWGFGGQVSYSPKSTLWVLAGMAPFLAVLFQALPYIDPKKKNYLKFQNVYQSFQLFFQIFMLAMVGIVITESFRPGTIQVSTLVTAMCGILFMFIGNIMPKFRQNFFCGFRTPWTLSDETVWNKTHRLGGRLMFAAGLLGFGGAFLPQDKAKMAMLLVPITGAVIIPYFMSYVWFRDLSKETPRSRHYHE